MTTKNVTALLEQVVPGFETEADRLVGGDFIRIGKGFDHEFTQIKTSNRWSEEGRAGEAIKARQIAAAAVRALREKKLTGIEEESRSIEFQLDRTALPAKPVDPLKLVEIRRMLAGLTKEQIEILYEHSKASPEIKAAIKDGGVRVFPTPDGGVRVEEWISPEVIARERLGAAQLHSPEAAARLRFLESHRQTVEILSGNLLARLYDAVPPGPGDPVIFKNPEGEAVKVRTPNQ